MEEEDEYWMESDSGSDGGDLDFDEGDGEEVRERAGCPPRLLTPPSPPSPRTVPPGAAPRVRLPSCRADRVRSGPDAGGACGTGPQDLGRRGAPCRILAEADVRANMREEMQELGACLNLGEGGAFSVLRHFRWDRHAAQEAWFSDEGRVREAVGLLVTPAASTSQPTDAGETCGICFGDLGPDRRAAPCGHAYCRECYSQFLATAVEGGASCLDLRCPHPECAMLVPPTFFAELLPERERKRYEHFGLCCYVDNNRLTTWCPAPGCVNVAALSEAPSQMGAADVKCKCGHVFCFRCQEEAHRPADCEMVRRWKTKNSAESENMNWIMANSKPCPSCKRPIEKNQGCMHMQCSVCGHNFCWLCGRPWSEHGEGTGGYYACNRYEAEKKAGKRDTELARRDAAKDSLERYMHYFERYSFNGDAAERGKKELENIEETLQALSDLTQTPTSQLRFVPDAWLQVIACSRTLKWTYAYGYYHFGVASGKKKEFFEFLQGEAEKNLLRLRDLLERDLKEFLEEGSANGFGQLQSTVTLIAQVTKEFFEKLAGELELGLAGLTDRYTNSLP